MEAKVEAHLFVFRPEYFWWHTITNKYKTLGKNSLRDRRAVSAENIRSGRCHSDQPNKKWSIWNLQPTTSVLSYLLHYDHSFSVIFNQSKGTCQHCVLYWETFKTKSWNQCLSKAFHFDNHRALKNLEELGFPISLSFRHDDNQFKYDKNRLRLTPGICV